MEIPSYNFGLTKGNILNYVFLKSICFQLRHDSPNILQLILSPKNYYK